VTAPAGLKPTGKVTVTIRKGSKTKAQRSATLKNGKAALTLPKLPRGTYKVTARYGGNANLVSRAAKSRTLRVVRN
jgi:hypothetical protein